jgi:serine/threonine-protein kinase
VDLAHIYVLLGEYDIAINKLEYLLSIPSYISVPILHLDPRWDPLRQHPKFQRLLEKYSQDKTEKKDNQ